MSDIAHKLIVKVGDCGGRLWTMEGTLRYSGPKLPAGQMCIDCAIRTVMETR
jgi:hypothetical protein